MGPAGGSEQLAISASQDWVASVSEPWLMLTPANGVGSTTGTVKIDTTLMSGRRTTDVAFLGSNGQRRTVSVVQFGFGKQIDIKEPTQTSTSYLFRLPYRFSFKSLFLFLCSSYTSFQALSDMLLLLVFGVILRFAI